MSDTSGTTSTTDPTTKEADKANLLKWNHILFELDSFLGLIASIAGRILSGTVKDKVEASLKLLYDNVKAANQQFVQAISDLEAGKPYNPIVQPSEIPDFPKDPTSVESTAQMAWDALRPIIEEALSRLPSDSPWVKVLEGLVENYQKTIDDIARIIGGPV